jgi:hypothetical protein
MFKIFLLSLTLTTFTLDLEATLTRLRKKDPQDLSSGGIVETHGVIKKGLYVSPENTCSFQIPILKKPGFKIIDKTNGIELDAVFTDKTGKFYKFDIFPARGEKSVEDWHKKSGAPQNAFLIQEYIPDIKFDLFKSKQETDIFLLVVNTNTSPDYPNAYQVSGLVLANDKIYMLTTAVHHRAADEIQIIADILHDKVEKELSISKKIMTIEEKKAEAKEIILKLLSNLYIWPEGTYK